MINTFQISNSKYLHALLPSIYSIRKTFPADTNIHACLVTTSLPDDVLKTLSSLDAKCHIVKMDGDKFKVLDIANDCFVNFVPTNADCFFIGSDCYSIEFADWSALSGDVIFGSKESKNQNAPKGFLKYCERIGIDVRYVDFYGSIVYIKKHCCESYFDKLRYVIARSGLYQYYDDMYERLAAALLGGFRVAVAPDEYEYKVVFPWTKTQSPKMIHMSFGLDWYKKDKIFTTFKKIISDFVSEFPRMAYLYKDTDWIEQRITNNYYKLKNLKGHDMFFRR